MPERNHEVIIDGFVFPDTVTVTLANDEYINSRDYVDKELYESISSANDYWQAENAKLRDENTRLLSCLTDDAENARQILGESRALQDDNDKLRELVEDMLDCIEIRMAFGRPPTYEMYEGFAQRAGELGIEVDALEVDG